MKRIRAAEQSKRKNLAREFEEGTAFVKGGVKPASSGRKKGTPNRTTRVLKELIFTAMDMVGSDGKGKDEAAGYLARVADAQPELFIPLLIKMLPYSLAGAGGGPVQIEYSSKEDIILRMKERGLPLPDNLLSAPKRKPPSEVIDVDFEEVEREEEEA